MFGAINGGRHDSFMLNESELLPRLCAMMPAGIIGGGGVLDDDPEDRVFALYANPAYPQLAYLFGGFRHPPAGSREVQWMPTCRVFAKVLSGVLPTLLNNGCLLTSKEPSRYSKIRLQSITLLRPFFVTSGQLST